MYFTRNALPLVFVLFASSALAAKPEKSLVCHVGSELSSIGETYMQNRTCTPPEDWDALVDGEFICPDAGKIDLIVVSRKAKHIGNKSHSFGDDSDYAPVIDGAGDDPDDFEDNTEPPDGIDDGCEEIQELIHVIAYTDIDPDDGDGFKEGLDVLIAKIIDGPGDAADGVVGEGDLVITHMYPLDFSATSFGAFQENRHTITEDPAAPYASSQIIEVWGRDDDAGVTGWWQFKDFVGYSAFPSEEIFAEETYFDDVWFGKSVFIQDVVDDAGNFLEREAIYVNQGTVSQADVAVDDPWVERGAGGNEQHIDVEIFVTD